MPSKNSDYVDDTELEQALRTTEQILLELKERYTQVKGDQRRKQQLQQQSKMLQHQFSASNRQQIKAQLLQIGQELEQLDLNLESRLFSWRSLREPFWLAVRFGGLGVLIGWFLKSLAG